MGNHLRLSFGLNLLKTGMLLSELSSLKFAPQILYRVGTARYYAVIHIGISAETPARHPNGSQTHFLYFIKPPRQFFEPSGEAYATP